MLQLKKIIFGTQSRNFLVLGVNGLSWDNEAGGSNLELERCQGMWLRGKQKHKALISSKHHPDRTHLSFPPIAPRWPSGKEYTYNAGDTKLRFDPWVGKSPWRRESLSTLVLLPWRIPWTEKPGRLYSTWGSQTVERDWATNHAPIAPKSLIILQPRNKSRLHFLPRASATSSVGHQPSSPSPSVLSYFWACPK